MINGIWIEFFGFDMIERDDCFHGFDFGLLEKWDYRKLEEDLGNEYNFSFQIK